MNLPVKLCFLLDIYKTRTTTFAKFSSLSAVAKMYTSRKKISKDKGAEPTEFEELVAQVIY
jgi:hypothetical protein